MRTHRYTRHQHWREGVILEYREHFARVELNPILREVRMVVWGVQPQTFITILKDTMDYILRRFEGLRVQRLVPCTCHQQEPLDQPCTEMYRYEEDLLRRMQAKKETIECPASFKPVYVLQLLYGIHRSTDAQVIEEIKKGQEEVLSQVRAARGEATFSSQRLEQLVVAIRSGQTEVLEKLDINRDLTLQILERQQHQSELIMRNFLLQWNLEMKKFEAECPGTFLVLPRSLKFFNPKKWISESYQLQLICQHPPGPHCVDEGYKLNMPKEWWVNVSPWLKHLITFLKYGVPMGHAIGAVVDSVVITSLDSQISLLETIVGDIADVNLPDAKADLERSVRGDHEPATGAALRAVHAFLDKADPDHNWGDLARVITPEGNILWLCAEHRKQYEAKPLVLPLSN